MSKIICVLNDYLRKTCIFPHTLRGLDTFWTDLVISPSQTANPTKWTSYSPIFGVDWVEVLRKIELDHLQLISRGTYITLICNLDKVIFGIRGELKKLRKPQIPFVNLNYQHQISPNSADTPRDRFRQGVILIFYEPYLHYWIKSADHIRRRRPW